MANGPRTIYSRKQRLAPGQYETPLADFLDRLPELYNRYQQNQLALERQQLAEKRYQDAQEKERKRYQDSLNQQEFNNHMKIYNSLDKSSQKKQYLQKFLQEPKFKNFNITALNDATSNAVRFENDYDDMSSRFQDIIVMPSKDQFSKYEDVDKLFTEIKGMLPEYRGTEYEKDLSDKYNSISALKQRLQEKSGKVISIDDAPFNVKSQYKNLSKLQETTANAFREAEASINEIANYNSAKKRFELIDEFSEDKIKIEDLLKRERTYNYTKKNLDTTQAKFGSFIEDNNLRYPEIVTAEKREAIDSKNKEMNDWFAENQTYLLEKAEEGGVLAEMLYDDLSGVDRYDRFQMLKGIVEQEKEFDKMFAELDEGDEQGEVLADNQVVDDREPYEIGAMEGATEMEPGVEMTNQDVDDVLASVRETTGFYPEGDAPRIEDRQETEPSPSARSLPLVAEQVQARPDRHIERIIERRRKQSRDAVLFPESDIITIDSLKKSSLKDAKGNEIDFSSAKSYNNQIDAMFREIQNINKQIRQSGMSREQRSSKLQNARQILFNLTQALKAKDIQSPKRTSDKNIKSTANSFLRKKKFSTISDLEKYFNNLLQ